MKRGGRNKGRKGNRNVVPETERLEPGGSATLLNITGAVLLAVPVLLVFLFVFRYGVNVCYWDAIDIVPVFQKYHSGTLDFSYLVSQHNEHRILTTRVAILLLGLVTGYDNIPEMYFIAVLMAATVGLLLFMLRDVLFKGRNILWCLPIPWVLLSFRQYDNILIGFQISFILVFSFAVVAFAGLRRTLRKGMDFRKAFFLPLACAVLSSYSSAQGLMVWPAGLIQILLSKTERNIKGMLAVVWVLSGLIVWGLYFHGYTRPGYHPSVWGAISAPAESLRFFFALLGNSLAWSVDRALPVGLALFGATLVAAYLVVREGDGDRDGMWIAIVAFAYLTLASITIGRAESGLWYAGTSRYATFSLLAVVGTYLALLEFLFRDGRSAAKVVVSVLCVLFAFGIPYSVLQGMKAGQEIREVGLIRAQILRTYRNQPDDALVAMIYPFPNMARIQAGYLERMRYNVFGKR